jgi:hypothetical protein
MLKERAARAALFEDTIKGPCEVAPLGLRAPLA